MANISYEDGLTALIHAANPNADPERVAASVIEKYGLERQEGESAISAIGWALGSEGAGDG